MMSLAREHTDMSADGRSSMNDAMKPDPNHNCHHDRAVPSTFTTVWMHERIWAQAAITPDAIALVCSRRRITYAELHREALAVAALLRQHGVRRGSRVAVMMMRSSDLLVSLLGVLQAGATYVPLDPSYPAERLRFMLEDTAVGATLVDDACATRAWPAAAGPVLNAAVHVAHGTVDVDESEAPSLDADDLAYVTYTSGSTGRPKAVGITHGNAAQFVAWAMSVFTPAELSTTLFATSVCFDLSVFEMFVPLATGATVLVAQDVFQLPTLAQAHAITLINTVPSLLAEVLRDSCLPASIRVINLAGEALPAALVRRLHVEVGSQGRLFNLYGPSECTTYSTIAWLMPDDQSGEVPIGVPIDGTTCHVLDDRLEPVEHGQEGELYIGGAGVGRGYLARPGMTAERFLPDPFSAVPGKRMYRTGDRVRQQADGRLFYGGRADFQVKLRGYRIELGEIESVIETWPRVARAIVMLAGDEAASRTLAAHVVMQEGRCDPMALRNHLRTRLPDYMLPTRWYQFASFPSTLNGKVDRAAIARNREAYAVDAVPAVSRALTGQERRVADLWEAVLGCAVDRSDADFFALGGHSLAASRMLVRLRRDFQIELGLRALFDAPDLAAFSAAVDLAEPALAQQPMEALELASAPLSYPQEMLFLEEQLHPANAGYNVAESFRIRGRLDVDALESALLELLKRHHVLRSRFVLEGEHARQQVMPAPGSVQLVTFDVIGEGCATRRSELVQRLQLDGARMPFALDQGPLLRAILVHTARDEATLILVVHHVATDGWSQSVLRAELGALYQQVRGSKVLPAPAYQYSDYAVWQRRKLTAAVLAPSLDYWRRRLQHLPAQGGLEPVLPRPAQRSYRGSREPVDLGGALSSRIRDAAIAWGTTPFVILLSALYALVYRTTGRTDVVVGSAFSVRDTVESETLVGDMTNTVVLRCEVDPSQPFEMLVRHAATRVLEAHQHQFAPFQQVVQRLELPRVLDRNPVFQTMLVLENTPDVALDLGPSLHVDGTGIGAGSSLEEFALSLVDTVAGFRGHVEYDTDLFDRHAVVGLVGALRTLLEHSLEAPACRLRHLPLVDGDVRETLTQWAGTARVAPAALGVGALIRAQARRTPQQVAVRAPDAVLDYAALMYHAGQLAMSLRAQGAGVEVRIGVLMERSALQCVCLLAILLTGATYVPLNPEHPAERIQYMAEDAGLALLLTASDYGASVPTGPWQVLVLDRIADSGSAADAWVEPTRPADDDALAYVLYTSGSSGRPKGVGISYRALANQLQWFVRAMRLTHNDRFLHKAAPTFDPALEEVLAPWLVGAAVIVASPAAAYDSDQLMTLVQREAVTCIDLTPTLLSALTTRVDPAAWSTVRLVLSGGETLRSEHVRAFRRCCGGTLMNTYGPTETTIQVASTYASTPELPIGRAIDNVGLHVLDVNGQLLPAGLAGELHVSGMALARGYVGKPALTATRFIACPYAGNGARMYRTGDLVRWLPDGQLHYLGRIDDQAKVRGYRIEPGEIEQVLLAHPAVRQVAVFIQGPDTDHAHIAACVVAPLPLDIVALRQWARSQLPDYMVPSHWAGLEALPVNSSGKIDRQQLFNLPLDAVAALPLLPNDPLTRSILEVFRDVLQRPGLSAADSFFEMGGHSLAATRVAARLGMQLGRNVPVRLLFQSPTATGLALALMAEEVPGAVSNRDPGGEGTALLASMEALSDAEVELLLEQMEQSGLSN